MAACTILGLLGAAPATAAPGVHEISIGDVTSSETDAVSGTSFSFQVTLNAPAEAEITVTATTESRAVGAASAATAGAACATAGVDYVTKTEQVTFSAGQDTRPFNVTVCGDNVDEVTETFVVVLTNPDNATIFDTEAVGTISNDDNPVVSIDPTKVSAPEGHLTNVRSFKLLLDNASNEPLQIKIDSADNTTAKATAGSDYQALSTTITVPTGSLDATFNMNILGDTVDEPDETFKLTFTLLAGGATVPNAPVITIANDDDPTLTIADAKVVEGGTGTTKTMGFVATLSKGSAQNVVITYSTRNGDAPGGASFEENDYVAKTAQTVTIPTGQMSVVVPVTINGDDGVEPDEKFFVDITADSNVSALTRSTAVGTIVNDDGTSPKIAIGNVSLPEGAAGSVTEFIFPVTLSEPTQATVTVNHATADGTATTATKDYDATSGKVTFLPGVQQGSITVVVRGDNFAGPSETFFVNLTAPSGATLANSQGKGTILNDDGPVLTVTTTNVTEGAAGGNVSAVFQANLSETSSSAVTVQYTTQNGTALAPDDYTTTSGTLTIPAGATTASVSVPIIGDSVGEPDETFTLVLSNPVGATPAKSAIEVTILNDDGPPPPPPTDQGGPPNLSFAGLTVAEGAAGGSVKAVFTATLSKAATTAVTVDYATQDGTARKAEDYTATSGTLTIPIGTLTATVDVPILGDDIGEEDETFTLALSNATGATLLTPVAQARITNDDGEVVAVEDASGPVLSVSPVEVTEAGADDVVVATFTASLSEAAEQTVSVKYTTLDQTAEAGTDFTSTTGTLTIEAGALTGTVVVPILGDDIGEETETFSLVFSEPVGMALAAVAVQATVLDDDTPAETAEPTGSTETVDARATDDSCPEGNVPEGGYQDTEGTVHESSVDCLGWWGITKGLDATSYGPNLTVSRGQMATFLVRMLAAAGAQVPEDPADAFSDDDGTAHERSINQLVELGVASGTGDITFSPNLPVSRGQMARFLVNAHEVASGTRLAATADHFADDNGTAHEDPINALAEVGVAVGSAGTYQPTAPVTRAQMASFIVRLLDLLVESGTAATPS